MEFNRNATIRKYKEKSQNHQNQNPSITFYTFFLRSSFFSCSCCSFFSKRREKKIEDDGEEEENREKRGGKRGGEKKKEEIVDMHDAEGGGMGKRMDFPCEAGRIGWGKRCWIRVTGRFHLRE